MATGNDYNVSLGTWAIETVDMNPDYRLTTYADLVAKTISMASEVLYQLGGESNINNIYVLDGRKTLPYQQLTHSDSVSVWLKPSETSLHKYMYRFNGEPGQLPKFTCDEQDPYGNNYSLEQCVNPSDITPVAPDKTIRFRFKNITFPPYIELVTPHSEDSEGYCTEVEINSENNHDLTDPHDVYVKMKNGRKARFIVGPYTTLTPSESVYIGDSNYYPGNVDEYQPSFDGSVWLTYTKYDNTETASLTSGYVTSPAIDVEPYQHQAYVTMLGKRNTPVYIQVETDGHIGVRQVLDNVPQSYSEVDDGSHGRTVVLPPDHIAYYNTTISNPGNSLISLKSQNDDEWDSYNAVVINLKTGTIIKTVDNSIFSTDFLISLENLQKGNQYAVQLTSIPKFHSVTVRITDYVNLDIDYLPNFDPSKTYDYTLAIPSSLSLVAGKWIHEFQTVEQTTVASNHIGICCKVTEDTTDHENIGHNKKKSLLKLSQSTNLNPAIQTFSGDSTDASVSLSYIHSQTRLPRIMNLYVRVLENVKINFRIPEGFYIRDKNQQWQTGTPYEDNPKYNQIELELDPERDVDFNQRRVTFHIQRRVNGEYNSLNGRFYYNDSWSGGNDTTVRFDGIPSGIIPVDDTEPYTTYDININNITFGVTNFSVVLVGTARSAMTINFHLPEFVSIASNNLMFPNTESILPDHLGAYIGLTTVDETLDGKALIWQNYATSIESDAGRPSSWSGGSESGELKTAYNYSFNTTGNDINIVLKGISSRDGFYLPTWLYKKLNISGSSEHWVSLTSEYTLSNNEYQLLDMGSAMSPAISGLLKSGVDNPVMDITAVSWGNPTIFIAMEIVSIESADAYMIDPKLILLDSGLTLVDLSVAHIDAMALNGIRVHNPDSANNVYKLLLPEYYRNSYPVFKGFNMYMTPHQEGENHLEEIESYEIRCYIPYDTANEFSVVRDIVPTDRLFTGDLLGSSFPYGISASYMDKDALIIIKPKAGEAKMQIVCMRYLDINGSPLTTNAFSDMQIYPDNSNTVVSLYINCRQSDANIDFEVDSELTPGGDANLLCFVTNNPGTAPNGSTYTHLVEIDLDDNMWDYNQHAAVSDFKYYGNQHIYFKLIYKEGTQEERTKKFDFRVCPVVKIWCSPISGNYMKNDAGTTHQYKLCVEEYYNNNGTVTTRYLNNGEALNYFMSLGVNLTWQYRQTSSTTNEFSTYFEEPVFNATNGEYTFKIKESLNAPESGKLYCTASITGQTSTWPQITSEVDVANMVTISGIHYFAGWNPNSGDIAFHGAMNTTDALMPPIVNPSNENDGNVLLIYLKFTNLSTVVKEASSFSVESELSACITTSRDTTAGVITTDVGGTIYTDVPYDIILKAKVTKNMSLYNHERVFDLSQSAVYGSGQNVKFTLVVPKKTGGALTQTFNIKLGAVIETESHNDTGGTLKPEAGQIYNIRVRGREWYLDDNENISERALYYETDLGRAWNVRFDYTPYGGTTVNIPNATPTTTAGVDYKSRRYDSTRFDINAPAVWGEDPNNPGHPYGWDLVPGTNLHRGDWGAWEITVVNNPSGLSNAGTLKATLEITDSGSVAVSSKWWYNNRETVNINVSNSVSVVKIETSKNVSPNTYVDNQNVIWTRTKSGSVGHQNEILKFYLKCQQSSASIGVSSVLQDNGFIVNYQVEDVVGIDAYNKIVTFTGINKTFFTHNGELTGTAVANRVYTGQPITFNIRYQTSTQTIDVPQVLNMGPVGQPVIGQSTSSVNWSAGAVVTFQIRFEEYRNDTTHMSDYHYIGQGIYNETYSFEVTDYSGHSVPFDTYFTATEPDAEGNITVHTTSNQPTNSLTLELYARYEIGDIMYPYDWVSTDFHIVGYMNFCTQESMPSSQMWFLSTSAYSQPVYTKYTFNNGYAFTLDTLESWKYATFRIESDGSGDIYFRHIHQNGNDGPVYVLAGWAQESHLATHGDIGVFSSMSDYQDYSSDSEYWGMIFSSYTTIMKLAYSSTASGYVYNLYMSNGDPSYINLYMWSLGHGDNLTGLDNKPFWEMH